MPDPIAAEDRSCVACKEVAALVAGLPPALLAAGCAGVSSGGENFDKPAVCEGPGCGDHKNRIERTIRVPFECERQG